MRRSFVLIVLLGIIVSFPYFLPGLPVTEDGIWAVVRQAEMHREIKDLQFPPRWSGFLNHGYGYPLFLFTYPLPYLLGEVFHLLGPGVVDTVKLLYVSATLLSGIAIFYLARKIWQSEWAGFLAAFLFLFAPYRLVNLYQRGSLGELVAWVFYPLLFRLVYKIIHEQKLTAVFWGAVVFGAFILTHNASVVLFLPFLLAWVLFLVRQQKKPFLSLKSLLIMFGLGMFLSAWFWLPAIGEKKFIALGQTPLTNRTEHFLSLPVLLGIQVHELTKLPLAVGGIHLLAAVLGVLSGLFKIKKASQGNSRSRIFFALATSASLLLLFSTSDVLWRLPLMREIDFPWRMLGVATFLLSLLGGSLAREKGGKLITGVLCLLLFLQMIPRLSAERQMQPDSYYESNDATTTSADELLPIAVSQKPQNRPAEKAYFDSRTGQVKVAREKSQLLELETDAPTNGFLVVNTIYFPGWEAAVDGNKTPITVRRDTGLISLLVPQGKPSVTLNFARTPVRWIADSLSVTGLILIVYLWFGSKKRFHC